MRRKEMEFELDMMGEAIKEIQENVEQVEDRIFWIGWTFIASTLILALMFAYILAK